MSAVRGDEDLGTCPGELGLVISGPRFPLHISASASWAELELSLPRLIVVRTHTTAPQLLSALRGLVKNNGLMSVSLHSLSTFVSNLFSIWLNVPLFPPALESHTKEFLQGSSTMGLGRN